MPRSSPSRRSRTRSSSTSTCPAAASSCRCSSPWPRAPSSTTRSAARSPAGSAPSTRPGTSPTRSSRCPRSRPRSPARRWRCRCAGSCWEPGPTTPQTTTRWPTRRPWTPSPSTPAPSRTTASASGPGWPARPGGRSVPGTFPDVAEEAAALDQAGHLGGDHALPGVVAGGDPAQHVTAEDRQVFRPVVVQVHEAAPAGQVVVQRLELGLDLDVVHGLELLVRRRPVRVDVELQAVLEQPAEALQDPARQLRVVPLVEQVDEARHPYHDADP